MGVHGKIWVLEEGFTKNQYIGGDCLKRGFGEFADLRQGGLARKKVFLSGGVDTPMHTMQFKQILCFWKIRGSIIP